MFIRKLDCLSPDITLYFKGENSHSSIFSGILTIIVYSICVTFTVFYAINFFNNANPQICYYNRYVEDAGEFPVNSSSMFSFIQLLDTQKNVPDIIDFDLVTIIGLQETVDYYEENNTLTNYNHWIYGPCNNSTDTEGISELINFEHFTESACIRKYYNKDEGRYYNTYEKNFIWPNILHGCSHPNRTFYGIIMEKCRNTSLKYLSDHRYCKSKEETIQYIKTRSINFQLIDQFTDVLNYAKPYRKYFYSISNGLFEESYTTNHLNLNPTKLISDEGIFMEHKKETLSYYFDINEKITTHSEESGIYVAFYFWMQNRMQYYERVYKKVQDVLSEIGGLCSIVLTFAEVINFTVNRYMSLFDTQIYMNEIENAKIFDKSIFRKNLDFIKMKINQDKLLFPPKNKNVELDNQNINNASSSKNKYSKDELDVLYDKKIFSMNKYKKKKKSTKLKNHYSSNKNILVNNIAINNAINNSERKTGQSIIVKQNTRESIKGKNDSQNENLKSIINNNNLDKNSVRIHKKKISVETQESIVINNDKYKMTFIKYLIHLFSLKKGYSYIKFYEYFRKRMISEENLILNHLNIEKLQKEKIEKINTELEKQKI